MTERFVKHATFVVERTYAHRLRGSTGPGPIRPPKQSGFQKPIFSNSASEDANTAAEVRRRGPSLPLMLATRRLYRSSASSIATLWIRATSESPFRSPRSSLSRSRAGRSWSSPSKGPFSMDTIRRKCVSRAQVRCLIPLATCSNRRYNHDRYHW